MEVIWDPVKARINLKKHGVSFADAEAVLWDPYALTMEDPVTGSEQRFVTLGLDLVGRILVVVYTHEENNIRLISARKASSGERKNYEK